MALGTYPTVSLSEARIAAEEARKALARGQDPMELRKQAKEEKAAANANSLESITKQWHKDNLHRWLPANAIRILRHFEKDVFPFLGKQRIEEIAVKDLKAVLLAVSNRGAYETAEKIRQWIGAVYRYAAMLEITDRNPAAALQGQLPKNETKHMPALPKELITEFYCRLRWVRANHRTK